MNYQQARILTLATQYESPRGRGHLGFLQESCKRLGLNVSVLGFGERWTGGGMAMRLVKEAIADETEDTIVLVVDAFDVLVLAGWDEILEKLTQFSTPIVFSAEKGCWPDKELSTVYPPPPLLPQLSDSESPKTSEQDGPLSPYRYLNAGGYIGYAGALREAIQELSPRDDDRSDQRHYTRYFLDHPDKVSLDYRATIFQTLFDVAPDDVAFDATEPTRVINRLTGTRPCILHGNGRGLPKEKLYHFAKLLGLGEP